MIPVPTGGNHWYLPVRAMMTPAMIEEIIRPSIIGRVAKPDSVGVNPTTI